jgi:4-deoxy-L-threo-5-hexosulose-uronate ketol-isomerase
MNIRLLPDPRRYATMSAAELRETFLLDGLFVPGEVRLSYVDVDRTVIGGAAPTGHEPLALPNPADLRAAFFAERRELGVLNVGGGRGTVTVDGRSFTIDSLDCLYVGRGSRDVRFASEDTKTPARFYLLSYPAHAAHPTTLARKADASATHLGAVEAANKRTIYKYIHPDGITSCQLVMGFTQLDVGSVWNTMPPHTHMRRSEVYLYFDLAPDARVLHLMGPPEETRHLVVADGQAVVSPPWSIHAGAGTTRYSFCWGMGGENKAFADMDAVGVGELR